MGHRFGRIIVALPVAVILGGCNARDAAAPPTSQTATPRSEAGAPTAAGVPTFVIVPAESKASYLANEEFFAGALRLIGIEPGKVRAVGSTQAIEGQFQFDPEHPDAPVGDNSFTVRLDTLKSDQAKRDDYLREIRDDGGPSFDAYPAATFQATAIERGPAGDTAGELRLALKGNLTVRNLTKPVTFDVKAQLSGNTLSGTATSRFRLSDFGIGPITFHDVLTVADEIGIEVQFTARAQP